MLFGAQDRPRRDRRRLGAGERRAGRLRGQAPDGADRRPVHREEAARVLAGPARPRAAGLAAGPRRRGADLLVGGDGGQGRGRARSRRPPRAAARGRHGAVRDHGLGVPGADALRRRAGAVAGGAGGLRALGGQRHRDRRGHRHAPAAGLRRRRAGRRHARRAAGGRVPGLRPRARRARDAAVPGAARGAQRPAIPARSWSRCSGSSNVASRKWAFEQYDSIVGSRTVRRPERPTRRC